MTRGTYYGQDTDAYDICGRCGAKSEDHEDGHCPCQPCRGIGTIPCPACTDCGQPVTCGDCNGGGFSEDTFAASERPS